MKWDRHHLGRWDGKALFSVHKAEEPSNKQISAHEHRTLTSVEELVQTDPDVNSSSRRYHFNRDEALGFGGVDDRVGISGGDFFPRFLECHWVVPAYLLWGYFLGPGCHLHRNHGGSSHKSCSKSTDGICLLLFLIYSPLVFTELQGEFYSILCIRKLTRKN